MKEANENKANRKDKSKKKKKALIGVGLSIAIFGVVSTAAITADYVTEKRVFNEKNNNEINEIINEDSNLTEKKLDLATNNGNSNDSSKAYGVSRFDVEKIINGTYSGGLMDEKNVFLTFDDGPSENTAKVLDILNKYNVHGTFFTIGKLAESNPEYIKRIYKEGHALGNHTYNHDFSKIYPANKISVENYMDEYKQTEDVFKEILGENFNSGLVRMPGGENSRAYYKDPNLKSLKESFEKEGIASVDWNALNGDAEGKKYTVSQMIDRVKKTSEGQNNVVVLMHDAAAKGLTVEALPSIIEYFQKEGYNFKIIN